MNIAVDAMGGDYAPGAVVDGAVLFAKENPSVRIILTGDKDRVYQRLEEVNGYNLPNVSIVHTTQVVDMDDPPVFAIRKKKDSSILRAVQLVKDGEASAVVTAGNTGAAVAATKLKWGGLKGISRPAIAVVMPSPHGLFVLLDVGATPDCKPLHLLEFGIMGSVYAEHIVGIKNPRVGLLSLGTEEAKGTELTREAYGYFQKCSLNFIGNIEGSDLFTDKVDVIVCEGFIGNVVLKVCESLASAFQHIIKEEIMQDMIAKLGALILKRTFKKISKKVHYAEYGGALLLGVNGTCIISHGKSNPQAIKNAINVAKRFVNTDMNHLIVKYAETVKAGIQ